MKLSVTREANASFADVDEIHDDIRVYSCLNTRTYVPAGNPGKTAFIDSAHSRFKKMNCVIDWHEIWLGARIRGSSNI
jgi:hypothetical protein